MNSILLFLGGIGMQELLVIGLIILVFFGAKKIPEFMKGIGKGVREFKDGIKEVRKDSESSEHNTTTTTSTTPPGTDERRDRD
jgi:sec-independent protein translocase protein TatA